jgi:hypothetical protein
LVTADQSEISGDSIEAFTSYTRWDEAMRRAGVIADRENRHGNNKEVSGTGGNA